MAFAPSFLSLRLCLVVLGALWLQSCTTFFPSDDIDPSGGKSREDYLALRDRGGVEEDSSKPPPIPDIPAMPQAVPPPPVSEPRVSVNVTDSVPLRDVLIELARQGEANVEIDPRIQGGVIFTARNQPFSEVLQRLCKAAGLRVLREGAYLRVEMDEPYQKTYAVDYLNLVRRATGEVTIATNVFDVDVAGSAGKSDQGNDNNSLAKVSGGSDTDFWSELHKSLTQILTNARTKNDNDKARFSLDKQAGLVTVFGDSTQQESVETYLKRLQRRALAQVLIEARIVEVELNDEFKSGINWRSLFNGASNFAARFGTVGAGAPFTTSTTAADGLFTASLNERDFTGILSLVRTFGTTRILSSPRLTVLNNQTAVLKVARNEVYFLTSAQFPTTVNANGATVSGTPVFSSTPRTVPVGLVMTVQPGIDAEHGRIAMTLRPTISRVVDRVNDPSIGLNAAQAGLNNPVVSKIPVLAVREMDSVLQLNSGEVAVMGGLMQDSSQNQDQGVPPFDGWPILGNLAKSRDNAGTTSELVILLKATILDAPQPDGADLDLYRNYGLDPRPMNMGKGEKP